MDQQIEIKKSDTIPNWSMFDVTSAQIQLELIETVDGEFYYTSYIFLFIDCDDDTNSDYNITLAINLMHKDAKQCAKIVFLYASTIFQNMSPEVIILPNDDETEPKIIDLRTMRMVPDGASLQ